MERGTILAPKDSMKAVDELRVKVRIHRFWKDELKDGLMIHAGLGMQFEPARVKLDKDMKAGDEGELTLKIDGRLVVGDGDKPVLVYLESTGPRIIGRGELV